MAVLCGGTPVLLWKLVAAPLWLEALRVVMVSGHALWLEALAVVMARGSACGNGVSTSTFAERPTRCEGLLRWRVGGRALRLDFQHILQACCFALV